MKPIITNIVNQGYKVKLIAFRNPRTADNTVNKRMEELVFHILGTKKTAVVPFFLDNKQQAMVSKRIWLSNLSRQAGLPNDNPDLNYLIDVEGMKRSEALEEIEKQTHEDLNKLIGKEFTVWYTSTTSNGRTYFNYRPYEPIIDTEDDESNDLEFDESDLPSDDESPDEEA